MSWVEEYVKRITQEKMTSTELWREIRRNYWKAFEIHPDKETDAITFGDAYNCAYAEFNHYTGELIMNTVSPHYYLGTSVDDLYNKEIPCTIYRYVNPLPIKLYQKYQDMRYALLPAVELFMNQREVDMDYDAKPDSSLATYRIESNAHAQRGIDAIYTAESINNKILKEVLTNMDHELTLSEARNIVNLWTTTFGEHKLVLVLTNCPENSEFQHVLKNVLEKHYEEELDTNQ